jgi:hypothetical protein
MKDGWHVMRDDALGECGSRQGLRSERGRGAGRRIVEKKLVMIRNYKRLDISYGLRGNR